MVEEQQPDKMLEKWRLILGREADTEQQVSLDDQAAAMDDTLEAIYNSDRKGGLGSSSPNVNRWLGDIRKYFPAEQVQLLQRDALERLGLQQMLLEPELLAAVVPDVHLVGTLLSLQKLLPERSRETARMVVNKVVEAIQKRLREPTARAIQGQQRKNDRDRRPRPEDIDWHQTIRVNMQHYQPDYKTILPVQLRGKSRSRRSLKHIILVIDQSGSMASSVVYAGVFSCILASLPSIKTHIVAFDTSVVDLTHQLPDPLDLLFALQLGGGTDIGRALRYVEDLVTQPKDTLLVLISDLFEGGNVGQLLQVVQRLQNTGLRFLPLLALNDEGTPAFDREIAEEFSHLGLQPFACTPDAFPELLARQLYGAV